MNDATHEQLWAAHKPDERYERYEQMLREELPRDELAWEFQCFACAFYHPLRGERGYDWGVCFSPTSPRAGMLNFEHYGCDEWVESDER